MSARKNIDLSSPCDHVAETQVHTVERPAKGCEDCLKIGGRWVHLRLCLACGKVGCCDSSPGRHASKHAAADGHPVIRSFEPGENWRWCFVHEVAG